MELGYLWLKGSGMFQLRSVAVRGGTESERVAVRDAVARAAAGRSLLALSPARVAGAIEQVPTIRLASVDRDFPHTLRIHIVPERAVALAVGPGHYRSLVAASGRVLRVFEPHEAAPALPRALDEARQRPVAGRRDALRRPRWPPSMRWRRARPTSAPSREREGGARSAESSCACAAASTSCSARRWQLRATNCVRLPGCCVATRRRADGRNSSTPTSRRRPARCHAARRICADRGARRAAQNARQWPPNRSEWRIMRTGMRMTRSCIVNTGLVALDAASPSELSERG